MDELYAGSALLLTFSRLKKKSVAIVTDRYCYLIADRSQLSIDLACSATMECMLQGVEQQFVDDQAE